MRLINKPSTNALVVFDDCRAGMYQPRKTRLETARPEIERVNAAYLAASSAGDGFAFAAEPVIDQMLKSDMLYLYEKKFCKDRRSNGLYDELIISASGECPYCGLDSALTLDHCLPKSSYPHLSVSPLNLVPTCWACNTSKASTVGSSINAYTDVWAASVTWIRAKMNDPKEPGLLDFFTKMPPGWSIQHETAVADSFKSNGLGQRYHDRAKTRWLTYKSKYRQLALDFGIDDISDHFDQEAKINANHRLNGWEAAAYRCWADESNRIVW